MTYRDELLRLAIKNGDTNYITDVVVGGGDINKLDEDGKTPLMFALDVSKNVKVIMRLIQLGSAVNVSDRIGETPLMYAFRRGSIDSIRVLIAAGADVNVKNFFGESCLLLTNFSGCDKENCRNKEIIELLLCKGADIHHDDTDYFGNTMLHQWCPCALDILRNYEMPPLEAKNFEGSTALMAAVIHNDFGKVEYLLLKGADPNCKDLNSNTPLHLAQDCKIVYKLIYSGANLNELNNNNERPLISLLKFKECFTLSMPINAIFRCNYKSSAHAFIKLALLIDGQSLYFNDIREFLVKFGTFESFFRFVTQCQTEIQRMKSNYFTNGITFFDLCLTDEYNFSDSLKRCNLELTEHCCKVQFLFPHYSDIINMKLKYYGFDITLV